MSKEVKKNQMKRKVICLETKIKILDRLRNGERATNIAQYYNMNESTIRTIKKMKTLSEKV